MRVVTLVGLVLNVCNGDRDTALTLFRGLVDVLECSEVCMGGAVRTIILRQGLGNSGSKSGLAMVNMTDGTNVYMRLGTLELFLCHRILLIGTLLCVFAEAKRYCFYYKYVDLNSTKDSW